MTSNVGLDFLQCYSKNNELNILFVGPKKQWEYKNNDYKIDIFDIEDSDSKSICERLSNNDVSYDLIIYYPYSFVSIDDKMLNFLDEMAFNISQTSHKRVSLGFYGQYRQDDFDYDDVRFYSCKYNEDSKECELYSEINFEGGWTGGAPVFIGDVLKEHLKLEKQNESDFSKKLKILPKK